MSNLKWDILAKTMRRLDHLGIKYTVNKRATVSSRIAGYKVLTVDIAILNKQGEMIIALYIGPRKERRALKFTMLKCPVYYFHTEDIEKGFEKMVAEYVSRLV